MDGVIAADPDEWGRKAYRSMDTDQSRTFSPDTIGTIDSGSVWSRANDSRFAVKISSAPIEAW